MLLENLYVVVISVDFVKPLSLSAIPMEKLALLDIPDQIYG